MAILAIVGMAGSGKSVLAAHLRERGVPVLRFGQIIEDEVVRRGLAVNPQNERAVREDLRAREGMDVTAQRSIPRIRDYRATHPLVAIDGLYSYSEYKTLHAAFGDDLTVLAVFTPRRARHARLAERPVRPLTPAEAAARDIAEIEQIEKAPPIALADYLLVNDTDVAHLLQRFDALLEQLV